MLKQEARTIGNTTYRVRLLATSEGRPILVRLTKLLGPSFGTLLAGMKGTSLLDAGNDAVAWAVKDLSERVTDDDLAVLCEVFGSASEVQIGDKVLPLSKEFQELHFAGKYGEMMRWIGFCVELNYADFLDGLLVVAGLKPGAATKAA